MGRGKTYTENHKGQRIQFQIIINIKSIDVLVEPGDRVPNQPNYHNGQHKLYDPKDGDKAREGDDVRC